MRWGRQYYPAQTPARDSQRGPFASAGAAAFVVVSLKVALGYFVHPKKSVLIPRTLLVWLGLSADFLGAAFSIPSAKGNLIFELLCSVLGSEWVPFTTLESLVGKLGALFGSPRYPHQVA